MPRPVSPPSEGNAVCSKLARQLQDLSRRCWGRSTALRLIGRSREFIAAQRRLKQVARMDKPVLVTGETGVGKEAFARALYLLSSRSGGPFLTVNCAQYRDNDLIVSELFGHTKGSFTGAAADRKGLFEQADGGMLFLDEVGELSPRAQAMLLRVLGEGEIKPLGASHTRWVDVRVVAATNRDLETMVEEGCFRRDLYYRLRYLRVRVPPVRERGEDWRLIGDFYLERLNRKAGGGKRFGCETLSLLESYRWPGNVREIQGIVNIGYCMSEKEVIRPESVLADLQRQLRPHRASRAERVRLLAEEGESFWDIVHGPFLDRELNRAEVRAIVGLGLEECGGVYKRVLPTFGIKGSDYLKFMDFLRHHRLKPVT